MKYAISAGHEITAATAEEILKLGGNAVDAAIAAYLTAFVTEPCMASGGGGAFATVYQADGKSVVLDFFCQTPKYKRPVEEIEFFPIAVDFGDMIEHFYLGKGSTAIPGSIAGIYALQEHFGTIPMKELVQPAIDHARNGVRVNNFQALDIKLLENVFRVDEQAAAAFFKEGEVVGTGDLLKMPELADFLGYLAAEGQRAFYEGEVAQKIVKDHQAFGGHLRMEDFSGYEVAIRKPLRFGYRNHTILTNPLPSTGGATMALQLKHVAEIAPNQNPLGTIHLRQLYESFSRVNQVPRNPHALGLALQEAYQLPPSSNNRFTNRRGSTSHLNVVDQWGNAISLTTTIGEGSGYFAENTGIHMNNMLGEAALLPNGFHSWERDVRLSSMVTPTIVLDAKEQIAFVLGSGGASRIPSAMMQVLRNLIDYDLPLAAAVNHPRVHLEHGVFNVEQGFEHQLKTADLQDELKAWNGKSMFYGGVHIIQHKNGQLAALGDARRDGVAIVAS
ncbi:MAG: gamma-glutamyltransferase family protein [Saprospiraceae bacterium]